DPEGVMLRVLIRRSGLGFLLTGEPQQGK
ncbi:hypothetical protein AVEN_10847-1, partial [Araneus ventricosus]